MLNTASFISGFRHNWNQPGQGTRNSHSHIFSESHYNISTRMLNYANSSDLVLYKRQRLKPHLLGEILVHSNPISHDHNLIGGPRTKEKAFQSDLLHRKNTRRSSNGDLGMQEMGSGGP